MYDRRTSQDRTAQAVKFTAELTASALGTGGTEEASRDDAQEDASDGEFEVGDIVGLVDRISTRVNPHLILGKILRTYPRKKEVLLAHLAPVANTRKKYKLVVGKDSWTESVNALVYPVDVAYDEETNIYTLRTTPLQIYNCVM